MVLWVLLGFCRLFLGFRGVLSLKGFVIFPIMVLSSYIFVVLCSFVVVPRGSAWFLMVPHGST